MPELPEVETTCQGIKPFLVAQQINLLVVRDHRLRWPVNSHLAQQLQGQRIQAVSRRGKYLLLHLEQGTLLIHLGMSGSLRIMQNAEAYRKHDHLELQLTNTTKLRYNDPRRFGAWIYTEEPLEQHRLLSHLGPEPLSDVFNARHLYLKSRKRTTAIKSFIMDARIVVGVGNIYANEALFISCIHPQQAAQTLTQAASERLSHSIKQVLRNAIEQGGTTLRDFVNAKGQPGYFTQSLNVYGRAGKTCHHCDNPIELIKMQNRSTFFCPSCQPIL